jgi:hypothetical protein
MNNLINIQNDIEFNMRICSANSHIYIPSNKYALDSLVKLLQRSIMSMLSFDSNRDKYTDIQCSHQNGKIQIKYNKTNNIKLVPNDESLIFMNTNINDDDIICKNSGDKWEGIVISRYPIVNGTSDITGTILEKSKIRVGLLPVYITAKSCNTSVVDSISKNKYMFGFEINDDGEYVLFSGYKNNDTGYTKYNTKIKSESNDKFQLIIDEGLPSLTVYNENNDYKLNKCSGDLVNEPYSFMNPVHCCLNLKNDTDIVKKFQYHANSFYYNPHKYNLPFTFEIENISNLNELGFTQEYYMSTKSCDSIIGELDIRRNPNKSNLNESEFTQEYYMSTKSCDSIIGELDIRQNPNKSNGIITRLLNNLPFVN